MFSDPAILDLLGRYKPISSLQQAGSLLGWDMETYMPEAGVGDRGLAQANIALMLQKMTLELKPMVREAEKREGDLTDQEKGVVRVVNRRLDFYEKVPPRLIEELQRTSTEATVAWRSARKRADFGSFRPYLEKLVALKREEAEKLGYEKHPYNALLDQYEEGLTVDDVDGVFSTLIPELKRILGKVMAAGRYPKEHALEAIAYEPEAMRRVNERVVEILGMPLDRFRMDVSAHPFTSTISPNDVRITTRYEGKNFKSTMYSTIHECGHAIYNLQIGEELRQTPIGRGASLGIHESQSRFWENAVGRSEEFVKLVLPAIRENLPALLTYDEAQVYYYLNSVRPSPIRVDADELTYNFHIALRYEIEKRLLAGEVSPSELPSIWNGTVDTYLGLRPKDDSEGVLQDIHWSHGSIGYFPTYSMGNVLLGVIWKNLGENAGLETKVAGGEFLQLRNWLLEKIHKVGATYAPKELLMRSFGEGYNPEHLVRYLEQKFLS